MVEWLKFWWLNHKEIDKPDVIVASSLEGYILKVDIEYLNELHEPQMIIH